MATRRRWKAYGARGLEVQGPGQSNILRAIDHVADQPNNTRAVCRKYYVHPSVLDAYTAGTMLDILQNGTKRGARTELDAEEAAVVWLLHQQLGVGLAS